MTTPYITSLCEVIIHSHNGDLLSIEETKKILNNPTLTEEQLTEIRDGYRLMAEVIFDKWIGEKRASNKTGIVSETKIINEHKIKL